jgi:predicted DNA-binding transcriptional regulator AlpA
MRPYMKMDELAEVMGMSPKGVANAISRGTFPVPTYRLGKARVADRAVVEAFFEAKRAEGLAAITTKG